MNQTQRFQILATIFLLALLSWCSSPRVASADSWSFAVLGDQQSP